MILIPHIIIALSSLVYAGYVFIKPSKSKFYFSYALIASTFISGIFLIISKPAHMVQSCIMGLLYLGVVSIITVFAWRKINTKNNEETLNSF